VFRQEHEKEKYTELTSLLKAKLIAEYIGTLQKSPEPDWTNHRRQLEVQILRATIHSQFHEIQAKMARS
jgi:hypothetical protein